MVEHINVLMIKMNTKYFLSSFNMISTKYRVRVKRENVKPSLIRESYTITIMSWRR